MYVELQKKEKTENQQQQKGHKWAKSKITEYL